MLQYLHSTCTSQDQLQIASLCSCTGKQHSASKDRLFSSSQTEMDPLQNLIFFWTVDVRTFEQFDMRTFLYLFETWLQRQMLGHNMTANVFPLQTTCSNYWKFFLITRMAQFSQKRIRCPRADSGSVIQVVF